MRLLPLAFAITLATACAVAPAQENKLPDIGSSAGELLTPARQAEYGKMMLAELRSYGYVLEDPLIDDWLQTMGTRLGANSDQPQQKFTFFMLRDRQINAFATLGGYVAVNAGLVLTAEREDEVAAVLSHEIAHVTQQHVLRGVERAQRDQIPILLGMLAAVVAAQQAGGRSSGDATQAAIASGLGLMQQRQIDYTRSNESEADRLGIRTLARSGYDVDAMAGFFERMSLAMRGNQGGYSTPDFLMTHPVTTTRISEARERAEQMKKNTLTLTTSVPGGTLKERVDPNDVSLSQPLGAPSNPLLPGGLQLPFANYARGPSGQ
ncbi:M48 family metalloprotease, partial [Xanthomonas sp. SHU 166]